MLGRRSSAVVLFVVLTASVMTAPGQLTDTPQCVSKDRGRPEAVFRHLGSRAHEQSFAKDREDRLAAALRDETCVQVTRIRFG